MDFLITQIQRALNHELYYLAVILTLIIPDVCSALESENGETNPTAYKSWCNTWLLNSYPSLNSTDLYSMRCGVLHQGKLGHPRMQYSRILFTLPNSSNNVLHNNIINDALNLDIVWFCRDMINAVSNWYAQKKDDAHVKTNLSRMVRLYPNGLPPYIVGIPIIS